MDEKIKVFIIPLCQRGPANFVIQNASVVGISSNESEGRMIN